MKIDQLCIEAQKILNELIQTPSISGDEKETADLIQKYLEKNGIDTQRKYNNVWAHNKNFNPNKPTLLLNSHHDTVKSNAGWSLDPFKPIEREGKLFGLGSNDAGASLVSLLATFLFFKNRDDLSHNIIFAATAEEETTGENGIASVLGEFGQLDLVIVGEPTGMQLAIAEKGLIVLDCQARGISGHAARDTGDNAILKALNDIQWLSSYKFDKSSKYLGPVKMTVTMIQAGYQHNVIPDRCTFTVDIRTTDAYTHDEILANIKNHIKSEVIRTSLRLNSSSISEDHALVKAARKLGITNFGSPTLSDQALLDIPSVKIGPGLSERSHTADEFVYLAEIEQGIRTYIQLLEEFLANQ